MRVLALALVGALLAASPLAMSGVADATTIQPGAAVRTSVGGCTLNFVFTDDARTYVGTAAHCVRGPGDRVEDWGTVVWRGDWACDFALLLVDEEDVPRVNPAVKRWGGPSGTADRDAAEAGTPLAIYGNGLLLGSTEPSRGRVGVLRLTNERIYASYTPAIFGDSGGPVLRLDTGEAFGVVASIGPYASTLAGPHMENVLQRLHAAGFDVRVETAPFHALVG